MKSVIILLCAWGCAGLVYGQDYDDPQNMSVDPQNTNCAQQLEEFTTTTKALEALSKTKFHLEQEIKTTRRSGLMQAFFGSCDFKTGILMVEYNSQKFIYMDVPVTMWDQLKSSDDIDGFYFKHIEKLPKLP